jgi:hypothetical protein
MTRRGVLPLELAQFLGIVLSCSRPSSLPAFLRRISRPFSLSSSDPNLLSFFTQICTFCYAHCEIFPGTFESSTQRREREREREREIFCIILEKTGDSSLGGTPVFFRGGQKIPMYDFVYDYPGTIHHT